MMAEYEKIPFAKCIFEGCPKFDKCARAQDAISADVNYKCTCGEFNCFKWEVERTLIETKAVPKEESPSDRNDESGTDNQESD